MYDDIDVAWAGFAVGQTATWTFRPHEPCAYIDARLISFLNRPQPAPSKLRLLLR
jgi:hypothetical protein